MLKGLVVFSFKLSAGSAAVTTFATITFCMVNNYGGAGLSLISSILWAVAAGGMLVYHEYLDDKEARKKK